MLRKLSSAKPVQQDADNAEHTSLSEPLATRVRRSAALPYGYILWLFTVSRIFLILVTYVGVVLLTVPKYSHTPTYFHTLLAAWDHWDAVIYVRIAHHGYQQIFDYAFFPFFSLCIWLVSHVITNYVLVGMLLSNLALLGALVILYQLARDVTNGHVARRTLFYLCVFPTAFYFFVAYNESFFLLFSMGAILAMRRRQWLLAGAIGALATATRSAGILLVLPYLCEWWFSRVEHKKGNFYLRFLVKLVPICLIPVGILLYSYYCWRTTGDPLTFVKVQVHWDRHTMWPWQGIWQSLYVLRGQPFGSFYQVHVLLDLAATLGFLCLTIVGWRHLPLSYTVWSAGVLLLILANGSLVGDPLVSNQRIVLELFPGFITLALVAQKHFRIHETILLLSVPLLAVLSIVFLMNRWMV